MGGGLRLNGGSALSADTGVDIKQLTERNASALFFDVISSTDIVRLEPQRAANPEFDDLRIAESDSHARPKKILYGSQSEMF